MTQEQFEQLLQEQKRTNELLEALLPVVVDIQKQAKSLNDAMVISSVD